jgi:hypothetical protein
MAYELLTGRNNLNTLTLTKERTLFLVSQILTHATGILAGGSGSYNPFIRERTNKAFRWRGT